MQMSLLKDVLNIFYNPFSFIAEATTGADAVSFYTFLQ